MRKLGIIQPGKIGDIIICLPIAKWYYDKGYEIIWPIDENIISNFHSKQWIYIPYVKFVPIRFDCNHAYEVCRLHECNTIIDLAFTIPGANNSNSNWYNHQIAQSFDEMKYHIADVPFEEKWTLDFVRNQDAENKLMAQVKDGTGRETIVVQEQSSDQRRLVNYANSEKLLQRIDIKPISESIFDWYRILQESEKICVIESSMSNFIDQAQLYQPEQKLTLMLKHGYYGATLNDGRLKGIPVLKAPWEQI